MGLTERYRQMRLLLLWVSVLLSLSACSARPGTVNGLIYYATPTGSPTQPIDRLGGNEPAALTSGASVMPAPLPQGFPHYFSFGVMNSPGAVGSLDEMRTTNGASFAFRSLYLTGGVNTGQGWETVKTSTGPLVSGYLQESAQHGYTPTVVYDELCQSHGVRSGASCSAHVQERVTANLADTGVMSAYFANWSRLLQQIGAFGKPVLVVVEPKVWSALEQVARDSETAAIIPASVGSSGNKDVANFPNTAQGYAWALLHMRDRYAKNAILALPTATDAAGTDIATDTHANLPISDLAMKEVTFLKSVGLEGNPRGVSNWDVLASDMTGRDAAAPGGIWWDRNDRTFPNFAQYLEFIGDVCQDAHRRIVIWQVPIGNQYFTTMNNTPGHYQDNRAEYILSHIERFADAGVIAVLFGASGQGTELTDAMHDGVTNGAPIRSYECVRCNTHNSTYPDDDGGYLRIFVGLYMAHPLPIT